MRHQPMASSHMGSHVSHTTYIHTKIFIFVLEDTNEFTFLFDFCDYMA